jgi:hypothetical protein
MTPAWLVVVGWVTGIALLVAFVWMIVVSIQLLSACHG